MFNIDPIVLDVLLFYPRTAEDRLRLGVIAAIVVALITILLIRRALKKRK